MLVSCIRMSKSVNSSPRYVRKRSYKTFDPYKFKEAVRLCNWMDLYLCEDVDTAVKILKDTVTSILDVMAPFKTIQIRKNNCSWLSGKTKDRMKKRDEYQRIASITQDKSDWKQYKVLRSRINNTLKYEEKMWQK